MCDVPSQDPFPPRLPSRRPTVHIGSVLAAAAGGCVGGPARYLVDDLVPRRDDFPWDTMVVNLVGSLALALLLVLILDVWRPSRFLRPFFAVGMIGSFTTFGTLMVDFDQLLNQGRYVPAGGYLVGTVAGGMAATFLGLFAGRGIAARHTAESRRGVR